MITAMIAAASVAALVLIAGGAATRTGSWFDALRKPRWNPPSWLFGPMWTMIAVLAVWSATDAWTRAPDHHLRVATLFGVNAVLNIAWSPLFFLMRRPDWALAEVVVFWLSIAALIAGLAPLSPLAAWLLVPYLAWVFVAALLNVEIVRLNAPFGGATAARRRGRMAEGAAACPNQARR